ncbi:Os06g0270966 [Oryza sativa Japonica Group]|uniref:Os06g0270966 protein n=1 Tax=Oryza sativa subsp. japonica TaxID=39947 RepID=A0A0P0WVI2_ORYSJ|nr:Os06g0270966 [Oryza sativa Japonica Group]
MAPSCGTEAAAAASSRLAVAESDEAPSHGHGVNSSGFLRSTAVGSSNDSLAWAWEQQRRPWTGRICHCHPLERQTHSIRGLVAVGPDWTDPATHRCTL